MAKIDLPIPETKDRKLTVEWPEATAQPTITFEGDWTVVMLNALPYLLPKAWRTFMMDKRGPIAVDPERSEHNAMDENEAA